MFEEAFGLAGHRTSVLRKWNAPTDCAKTEAGFAPKGRTVDVVPVIPATSSVAEHLKFYSS